MAKPDENETGDAETHPKGQQTDRTREHQWDKQGAGKSASDGAAAERDPATDGKHRLAETRQQHDPAEKESEIRKTEER